MSPAWAPLGAFGAGLASSLGPCTAPRVAAVAGLTGGVAAAARAARLTALVGGLCLGYVALGTIAGTLTVVNALTSYAYALIAAAMTAGGVLTIVRATPCCGGRVQRRFGNSAGAAFLAGLALIATGGPCCGPLAAAFAALTPAAGGALARIAVLAAFALGHAAPLFAFAGGAAYLAGDGQMRFPHAAGATVGGALMLAFGGYYALLA